MKWQWSLQMLEVQRSNARQFFISRPSGSFSSGSCRMVLRRTVSHMRVSLEWVVVITAAVGVAR